MSGLLRIVFSGDGFFEDDLQYLKADVPIQISSIPGLGKFPDPQLLAEKTRSCDLVIFMVNGGFEFIRYLQTHEQVPFLQGLLNSSKIKKALWSVDTHVMQGLESQLSRLDFFDKIYSAHSNFIGKFDEKRSGWLPCCYRLSSIKDLMIFNRTEHPIERDLLFYYNLTPTGDRNARALEAKRICDQMGLSSLFGHIGGWSLFPQFIKSSKINLNLSMQKELNYRFFELQAFNAIQVFEKNEDAEKMGNCGDGVFPIQTDLSDLEKTLNIALKHPTPSQGEKFILESHLLLHRIITIVREIFGISLKLELPTQS